MSGELYDDLVRAIRDKGMVAVVGAGVAIAATGRNQVAGWIGLLRHGVERIEGLGQTPTPQWAQRQIQVLDEAENGRGDMDDLLGVAEQISARLGARDNGEWVHAGWKTQWAR